MNTINSLEYPPLHSDVVDINRETWDFYKRWENLVFDDKSNNQEFWDVVLNDRMEIFKRHPYSLCMAILNEYIIILQGYHNATKKGEINNV